WFGGGPRAWVQYPANCHQSLTFDAGSCAKIQGVARHLELLVAHQKPQSAPCRVGALAASLCCAALPWRGANFALKGRRAAAVSEGRPL
ncbi:MAG: hypothetical protein FWD68_20325, partial [Alphaproteobacteria bacterium]|nr:hypothetical protein [Alphaproteobacteria bacterium]